MYKNICLTIINFIFSQQPPLQPNKQKKSTSSIAPQIILYLFVIISSSSVCLGATHSKGNPAQYVTVVNLQNNEQAYQSLYELLTEKEQQHHAAKHGPQFVHYIRNLLSPAQEHGNPPATVPPILFTYGEEPQNVKDNLILGVISTADLSNQQINLTNLKEMIKNHKVCALALTDGEALDNTKTVKIKLSQNHEKEFDGWKQTKGAKIYQDLHHNYRIFVKFLEKEIELPVAIISTGPDKKSIIVRQNPFTMKVEP